MAGQLSRISFTDVYSQDSRFVRFLRATCYVIFRGVVRAGFQGFRNKPSPPPAPPTPRQNALRMSTKFNIRSAFYFRSGI